MGEDGIVIDGIPLDQRPKSERIRFGLDVVAAMNQVLRVVRIEDATELDSESRAAIERWAAENDLQVWEEIVTDDPTLTIVEG